METIGNVWLWTAFAGIVLVMLAVDLFVVGGGKQHRVSMREAATWSGVWVSVSFLFAAGLWWYLDGSAGREKDRHDAQRESDCRCSPLVPDEAANQPGGKGFQRPPGRLRTCRGVGQGASAPSVVGLRRGPKMVIDISPSVDSVTTRLTADQLLRGERRASGTAEATMLRTLGGGICLGSSP
jgi:hypothetical protein